MKKLFKTYGYEFGIAFIFCGIAFLIILMPKAEGLKQILSIGILAFIYELIGMIIIIKRYNQKE